MIATQYLALLRGINVGGKNIIKMLDLKACFENMGFTEVDTYIQSGNVIFKSSEKDTSVLSDKIEKGLSERFNYKSLVVILSYPQLKTIVKEAPPKFNKETVEYKCDVIFIKAPYSPSEAMKSVRCKEGVDEATAGQSALYFSRLMSKAGQSQLSKIISLPVYQHMTTRNWNTTSRLLEIMSM